MSPSDLPVSSLELDAFPLWFQVDVAEGSAEWLEVVHTEEQPVRLPPWEGQKTTKVRADFALENSLIHSLSGEINTLELGRSEYVLLVTSLLGREQQARHACLGSIAYNRAVISRVVFAFGRPGFRQCSSLAKGKNNEEFRSGLFILPRAHLRYCVCIRSTDAALTV